MRHTIKVLPEYNKTRLSKDTASMNFRKKKETIMDVNTEKRLLLTLTLKYVNEDLLISAERYLNSELESVLTFPSL